jgi:hypothetical protein
MFVQKIHEAGEIDPKSDLASKIRKVTSACLQSNSLENAIAYITGRKLQAVTAIYNSSWEDLGLEKPKFSLEERCEIMGTSVEEMEEVKKASEKLSAYKKARGQEESEVFEDF